MIFCNLGSGSKGNSTYIQSNETAILIDQGFSLKNLTERMNSVGLDPADVDAIILTHDHSDHCRGIGTFGRKHKIPIYITAKTKMGLDEKILKNIVVKNFNSSDRITIKDIKIRTFHIPHDAVDPVGMIISAEGKQIGHITDCGDVKQSVLHHIPELDLFFLESNHDMEMLLTGDYPLFLKQRIKSRVGHLSNDQAIDLLNRSAANGKLKHLILGHLSAENNTTKIVRELFKKNAMKTSGSYSIEVASQDKPGTLIKF